jgi:hypothetical protein
MECGTELALPKRSLFGSSRSSFIALFIVAELEVLGWSVRAERMEGIHDTGTHRGWLRQSNTSTRLQFLL